MSTRRRIVASALLVVALALFILASVLLFLPGRQATLRPTPTAVAVTPTPSPTPTPTPTPVPILTVQGPPPTVSATASYLLDMDTGHMLEDSNGEKPLPMASTTKIMTALIAIQTANPDQVLTVGQDAIDRVGYTSNGGSEGSSAYLQVGEQLKLKDLLYALLLPSGDDAAVVIADGLGGTSDNFVQRMNLFANRLHLYQTHYVNPDGLTPDDQNDEHYTTAADLTRLARYAMHVPLFAQIVQTPTYTLAAGAQNHSHIWKTTNTLLTTYAGMVGIKTGHTDAAGWCLVFAATRNGHHLLGTVLGEPDELQRDQDVQTLLNWGFALPLLPPAA